MKNMIIILTALVLVGCSPLDITYWEEQKPLSYYALPEHTEEVIRSMTFFEVLMWVESFPYYYDVGEGLLPDTWATPMEFLYADMYGKNRDCEDFSIFLSFIAKYYFGYEASIVAINTDGVAWGHMVSRIDGVLIEPQTGTPYNMGYYDYILKEYTIEDALHIAEFGVLR